MGSSVGKEEDKSSNKAPCWFLQPNLKHICCVAVALSKMAGDTQDRIEGSVVSLPRHSEFT